MPLCERRLHLEALRRFAGTVGTHAHRRQSLLVFRKRRVPSPSCDGGVEEYPGFFPDRCDFGVTMGCVDENFIWVSSC